MNLIKQLREKTGVGIAKCKEALVAVSGDLEKAVEELRKLGIASAVKKEGREVHEGAIGYAENEQAIVFIELNAESDFVVQNEKFQTFLQQLAQQVVAKLPHTMQDLLDSPFAADSTLTVDQFRAGLIQSLGENLQIRRFEAFAKGEDHSIGVYIHSGSKLAALVQINGSGDESSLARDIAMHVAASSPEFLSPDSVPQTVLEKEREIARSLMKGKPPQILEGIVEGKVKAFCQNVCLSEQEFIKDPKLRIKELVSQRAAATKKPLQLANFVRWSVAS